MTAAQARGAGAPLGVVDLQLEDEPAGAVSREEVLDRLRPLAARSRRTDAGIERDQGRPEVAALEVTACRRAEVAADRRALPHLVVGDVGRGLREQPARNK